VAQLIREAADLIRAAGTVLLTTHIEPDADGIGSELALAECLDARGLDVTILNPGPAPRLGALLDPDGRIQVHDPDRPVPSADLLVVLDTGVWAQLGTMAAVVRDRAGRCLVIDHHVTCDDIGDVTISEPAAPCTGLLVLEVTDELGWTLTAPSAEVLFAALVFDTGWLRYHNAGAPAYEMAARLVRAGAAPNRVYLALDATQPAPMLRLTGMALAGLELECNGALAVMTVTSEMLAAAGVDAAEVTNLVNHCYAAEGVHSAVLFVEQPDGEVKVSLRSRGVVDVSALALGYGGGGHARAAGARLAEPLADVKRRVVADLCRAIR